MNSTISKIKKLQALSNSPNQHEAESALAKMQELMSEHHIVMSDINNSIPEELIETMVSGKGKQLTGEKMLLMYLSKYNGVEFYIARIPGMTQFMMVGRETNVAVVTEMYNYLHKTINRLASNIPGGMRDSYKRGIVSGLEKKIREKYEIIIESDETGLVIHEMANRKRENNEFMRQYNVKTQKVRDTVSNYGAYANGRSDASSISLHDQVAKQGSQRAIL